MFFQADCEKNNGKIKEINKADGIYALTFEKEFNVCILKIVFYSQQIVSLLKNYSSIVSLFKNYSSIVTTPLSYHLFTTVD